MMGLSEIKKANDEPTAFARSRLSDGQLRRNDSPPNNFWSEDNFNAHIMDKDYREVVAEVLPEEYWQAVQLYSALSETVSQAANIRDLLGHAMTLCRRLHATEDDRAELRRVLACINNRQPIVDLRLLIQGMQTYIEASPGSFPVLSGFLTKMRTAIDKLHTEPTDCPRV